MPEEKSKKPLYQRGEFRLYPRAGRSDRDGEPETYEIVWYCPDRKRNRSSSTGTSGLSEAKTKLDAKYLEATGGDHICPECGQSKVNSGGLVTAAIADYLTLATKKTSYDAIRHRLNHVLRYIEATGQSLTRCAQVDDTWIERFRTWSQEAPIVSPTGKQRQRSLATTEASVHQLAAAINAQGGVEARFKGLHQRQVNQTPTYRADVAKLIEMFRYCLYPKAPTIKVRLQRKQERANLLNFLRISVVTMARPDAAHDVSTDPKRKQWHPQHRVLDLNPHGRRQTKKHRAIVPVAARAVPMLEACDGYLIPVESVRQSWEAMAIALNLPRDGESGMKLIRRSVANIVRSRLPQEAWGELEMFMGHDNFDDITDLYAPFSPTYLRRALTVIEKLTSEIEKGCAGAWHRANTAQAAKVVPLAA